MEQNPLWNGNEAGITKKIAQKKGVVALTMAIVLLAFGLSICPLFLDNYFLFSIVQPLSFFAAGLLHTRKLNAEFGLLTAAEKWKYTSLLAAFVFLLFCGFSFGWVSLPVVMLLAGPVAFVLPSFFSELFRLHLQLSFSNAIAWQLTNELSVKYPDVYLTGIPVRFKIMLEENGKVAHKINFRALGRMTLGEVFCDLVLKEAKKETVTIELVNKDQKPYRWIFYTKTLLGWETAFDPTVPLHKNNIKEKTVIYVQRLSEAPAFIPTEKKKINFVV